MSDQNRLSSSQEDYLEAISHIITEKQAVRAKDIAKRLKVKNASVTGALRVLAEKGLINYAPYDVITLTPEGRLKAEDVVRRHEVLRDFFCMVLGVAEEDAERGACEMEHAVSKVILDKLIRFKEFLELCPRAGNDWINAFSDFCEGERKMKSCISCTSRRLEDLKGKQEKEDQEGKNIISLQDLKPGMKGRIVEIKEKEKLSKALRAKGFATGSLLEAETNCMEDDTIEIKLKGYHLSLGPDVADRVMVELIE